MQQRPSEHIPIRMLYTTLVLLLACLSACITKQTTPTPPAFTPFPVTPLSAGANAVLGIELHPVGNRIPRLELAEKTGAKWARIQLRWDKIEPTQHNPPSYRWSQYDAVLSELSRRGFRTVVTVRENPPWTASTRCGALHAHGADAFVQFLSAAVRRYRDAPYHIKHWEIYNEPDNTDPSGFANLGGCWGNDPAGYAAILKLAYRTIKAEDPEAIVLFGGLALEKFEGSPFNVDFLSQVLAAGGGAYFDWMSFHYYPAFSYRWDAFGQGVEGKAAYIRKVMQKSGIEKPIACSEIGQPSAGPAAEQYSEAKQAQMVIRENVQAIHAGVPFAIWYCWQDTARDERAYGLLDATLTPKPAYATYTLLGNALSNARYAGVFTPTGAGSEKMSAYRFSLTQGNEENLVIAWRKEDGPAVPLPLPAKSARLVDYTGQQKVIVEGRADDLNPVAGALSIGIDIAPILIYY